MLSLDTSKVKAYSKKDKERVEFYKKQEGKSLLFSKLKKSIFDTAQFSHTTPQGDVFILAQDNMPCLKPGTNSYVINMPNANNSASLFHQPKLIDQMPNGYNGKPFFLVKPNIAKPIVVPQK